MFFPARYLQNLDRIEESRFDVRTKGRGGVESCTRVPVVVPDGNVRRKGGVLSKKVRQLGRVR